MPNTNSPTPEETIIRLQDRFMWLAIYEDGSFLRQIDEDGTKHGYGDIDRDSLISFRLITPAGNLIFAANFELGEGKNLVWRRRVAKRQDQEGAIAVHLVGHKGRYVAMIMQDGASILFNNFKSDDALLNFPQHNESEGEVEWVE